MAQRTQSAVAAKTPSSQWTAKATAFSSIGTPFTVIVAAWADIWNAFGTPQLLTHKLSVLDQHCAAIGRDRSTIGITVNAGIIVRDTAAAVRARLDELGEVAGYPDYAASNQPYGTPLQVAERLAEYARVGVSEVIAMMPAPYDHETIERLATEVRPLVDDLVN